MPRLPPLGGQANAAGQLLLPPPPTHLAWVLNWLLLAGVIVCLRFGYLGATGPLVYIWPDLIAELLILAGMFYLEGITPLTRRPFLRVARVLLAAASILLFATYLFHLLICGGSPLCTLTCAAIYILPIAIAGDTALTVC
jgi:hypothetical protein